MNSTPKQQDGDGSIAASGSRSALEQTVLGVAPPPPSGLSPTPPVPAAADPAAVDAVPSTIVAAPTIALSSEVGAVPAAPEPAAAAPSTAEPLPHPHVTADVDATMRVPGPAAPSPPARDEARERSGAPSLDGAREQTALSADYLREAREAALAQLASGPPAPPVVGVLDPAPTPMPQPHGPSAALPSSEGASRSVAPPLGPAHEDAAGQTPNGSAPPTTRGFEPVPVLRAHLAESLSAAFGPLADLGGPRHSLPLPPRLEPPLPRAPEPAGRLPLLVLVALLTVAVVSLGGHLLQRYRTASARQRALASAEAAASRPVAAAADGEAATSRALLANRPAPEPSDGRVRVLSATGAGTLGSKELAPGASPESQLAATAARHVLSGNYAEALPVYRQLERSFADNTSYAAMARLLEKKVGSSNDTRTVTPAPSGP